MQDIKQRLEKLLTDAEEYELIARLTTVPTKREAFMKLADDYRKMVRELETLVINNAIPNILIRNSNRHGVVHARIGQPDE